MNLIELKELVDYNELDILYKIIDKCQINIKRMEDVVIGNKSAGVDLRKVMQDVRLMSEIIRDEIQRRHSGKSESKLQEAIEKEEKRLVKEEIRIANIEKQRLNKEAGQINNEGQ